MSQNVVKHEHGVWGKIFALLIILMLLMAAGWTGAMLGRLLPGSFLDRISPNLVKKSGAAEADILRQLDAVRGECDAVRQQLESMRSRLASLNTRVKQLEDESVGASSSQGAPGEVQHPVSLRGVERDEITPAQTR